MYGNEDLSWTDVLGNAQTSSSSDILWESYFEWDVLDYPVTPVVDVGAGLLNTTGQGSWSGIGETDFTWSYIAGMRWDFAKNWFVKGMYRWRQVDFQNLPAAHFDGYYIAVGLTF